MQMVDLEMTDSDSDDVYYPTSGDEDSTGTETISTGDSDDDGLIQVWHHAGDNGDEVDRLDPSDFISYDSLTRKLRSLCSDNGNPESPTFQPSIQTPAPRISALFRDHIDVIYDPFPDNDFQHRNIWPNQLQFDDFIGRLRCIDLMEAEIQLRDGVTLDVISTVYLSAIQPEDWGYHGLALLLHIEWSEARNVPQLYRHSNEVSLENCCPGHAVIVTNVAGHPISTAPGDWDQAYRYAAIVFVSPIQPSQEGPARPPALPRVLGLRMRRNYQLAHCAAAGG